MTKLEKLVFGMVVAVYIGANVLLVSSCYKMHQYIEQDRVESEAIRNRTEQWIKDWKRQRNER